MKGAWLLVCWQLGAMIFVGLLDSSTYSPSPPPAPAGSLSLGLDDADEPPSPLVNKLKGSVAVFGSCVTMAVYYILMKPVLKIYPPVTVTAWSYCFGALVMGAVSLMYEYPCPSCPKAAHVCSCSCAKSFPRRC